MSALSIRAKVIAVIAFMLIAMSGMGLLAIRTIQGVRPYRRKSPPAGFRVSGCWVNCAPTSICSGLRCARTSWRKRWKPKHPLDKRLAGILDRIAKDRKTYELLINSAEERAIYQNWSSAWDKYIAGVQDVIVLSRGSIGRIPTEASEAISKKVAVIAAESDAFLEKGINLNNTGADTATRQAAEGYNFAFWLVLSIVAAVVICGVGIGMYLVRDLSNGIAVRREADAGAGKRRPVRRSDAPRREDRNRRHGGRACRCSRMR